MQAGALISSKSVLKEKDSKKTEWECVAFPLFLCLCKAETIALFFRGAKEKERKRKLKSFVLALCVLPLSATAGSRKFGRRRVVHRTSGVVYLFTKQKPQPLRLDCFRAPSARKGYAAAGAPHGARQKTLAFSFTVSARKRIYIIYERT